MLFLLEAIKIFVAELRRLFIDPGRLNKKNCIDRVFPLNGKEAHYLNRVLRLRSGDPIEIVDGLGHLWKAKLIERDLIQLVSSFQSPQKEKLAPKPLIGLAVVLPKRGFDELLRMSCEIGVDIIQPLLSERGVVRIKGEGRSTRWEGIIREAVEQSERLWKPNLRSVMEFNDWLPKRPGRAVYALASTRLSKPQDIQSWTMGLNHEIDEIWIAIGPEGGWTSKEQFSARQVGCIEVQLGDSIMRTSTAAVAATQLLVSWRRNNYLYV